MQDINISTIIGSTVPFEEQLKLIKNAGFDGFFLTYTGIEPLVSWAETAYQLGLKFETRSLFSGKPYLGGWRYWQRLSYIFEKNYK